MVFILKLDSFFSNQPLTRILCLDLGQVWTGLATTDLTQTIVKPLDPVKTSDLIAHLKTYLSKNPTRLIIFGAPYNNKGEEGPQFQFTKIIVENIKKNLDNFICDGLEFLGVDERRSSLQAKQVMNLRNTRNPHLEHSFAAALVLEMYIEQRKNAQQD